jgi:integrase
VQWKTSCALAQEQSWLLSLLCLLHSARSAPPPTGYKASCPPIGLPIVNERKQGKPAYVAREVEQIVSWVTGRYRVLFALLAGSGLRPGEATGLKVGEHVSPDCKTLYIRQSVWNGKEQDPKTENAIRDVDVCSDLAVMLIDYIGNRTSGFLFHTDSGKPLSQRNILRDGLNPILAKLNLKQNGKAFHSFRRFRVMHLRKNRVP